MQWNPELLGSVVQMNLCFCSSRVKKQASGEYLSTQFNFKDVYVRAALIHCFTRMDRDLSKA
jgi:hypothetical protein